MIKLTRIDGSELTINANYIEVVEATPDTVVTLITNKKYLVKETPQQITELAVEHYKQAGGPRMIVNLGHSSHPEDHVDLRIAK